MKITLTKKDFRIDTFRSGGKGGQHQNVTDSGVRVTHLESGISCESRDNRSQPKNRKIAFERILPKLKKWYGKKLLDSEVNKVERENREVRVYNDKRGTVKDHRTGLVRPLKSVLDGDIEDFVQENLILDMEERMGATFDES